MIKYFLLYFFFFLFLLNGGMVYAAGDPISTNEKITLSTELSITGAQYGASLYTHGTVTGTVNVDWDNGNVQHMILGGNITLNMQDPMNGGTYLLILEQDGTGSRLVTDWETVLIWPGGDVITLTTTGGSTDYISLIYLQAFAVYHVTGTNTNF